MSQNRPKMVFKLMKKHQFAWLPNFQSASNTADFAIAQTLAGARTWCI